MSSTPKAPINKELNRFDAGGLVTYHYTAAGHQYVPFIKDIDDVLWSNIIVNRAVLEETQALQECS